MTIDLHLAAGLVEALDLLAARDQRQHFGFRRQGLVAEEFRCAQPLAEIEPERLGRRLTGAGPGLPRLGSGARHLRLEAVFVHAAPAPAQHVARQVEREAVCVVEPEGDRARQRLSVAQPRLRLVEQPEAAPECELEALLLQPQRLRNERRRLPELREGPAHLAHQHRGDAMQERLAATDHVRMAHGAAHDPAQHIAPALVGRQHAVGDQEAGGAQMVGDHPVRDGVRSVRVHAGGLGRGQDQRPHQVDVVIVVLALQHGGEPLQPHAGVDGGARQRNALLRSHLLELHEDQVPDLDEPVAVLVRAAGRAAGNVLAVVVEDFRAGAAGAGIAHRPEIVRGRDAQDAALGQPRDLFPEARRLVVLGIDGDQQPVRRQAVFARHQVPGKLDGEVLEIVAEGEIAQHFEEGVVPGGVAHILQVVVLAAGAHAFLRGDGAVTGAPLAAGEDVLELHHARIGEHERRVVARHQGAGRDDLMPVPGEVVEKGRADLARARHASQSSKPDAGRPVCIGRPAGCPPAAVRGGRSSVSGSGAIAGFAAGRRSIAAGLRRSAAGYR